MSVGHLGPEVSLDDPAFIHPTALIHGKVRIGRGASVWPYAVFRAEMFEIVIGERTNIQDFVMIHVGAGTPTIVGADCSITHHATLHGCTIGDSCLIGIGATVMDGAVIGEGSIVAGHAIVTEGSVFPAHSIIAGSPARRAEFSNSGLGSCASFRYCSTRACTLITRLLTLRPVSIVSGARLTVA